MSEKLLEHNDGTKFERWLFGWGWTLFFAGIPLFGASAPGLLLILIHWAVSRPRLEPGWSTGKRRRATTLYNVAVIGLVAAYALSIIPANNPSEAFRLGMQATIVAVFGLTYAYRVELRKPGWWGRYMWPLPLAGVLSAGIGLWQYAETRARVAGVHDNPNQLSTAILINLFLGVAVLSRYLDWRRWLIIPYVALLLAGILVTGSRGAWAGFVAGFSVFLALLVRRNWHASRKRALVLGVGGLIAAVLVASSIYISVDPRTQSRITSMLDLDANQDRVAVYATMTRMIKANPWLGVGVGNIRFRYGEFRENARETIHDIAHNYFLHSLGETGIVGTIFLLILWVVWLGYGWPARDASLAVLLLYSLLIALLVRDQFDNALTISYMAFLLNWLGGTLVGAGQAAQGGD